MTNEEREELTAMERRARMFEAANEKMLADNKRLREENAQLQAQRKKDKRLNHETESGLLEENVRLREENEQLKREAVCRIEHLQREQDAILELVADYNEAVAENARLREENDAWRMDGGSCAGEVKRLREENARLVDILDDVLAQWDGDWPEELYARVKAAIREAGKEG